MLVVSQQHFTHDGELAESQSQFASLINIWQLRQLLQPNQIEVACVHFDARRK